MNNYLFGFEGRIDRNGWWIGQFVLIGIFVLWFMIYGVSSMPGSEMLTMDFDSTISLQEQLQASQNKKDFNISYLLMAFPFCWVWMAITAKRLHDVGKSGWWGVPGFAPSLIYAIVFFIIPGIQFSIGTMGILGVTNIVQSVAGLWLLRTCGFKNGDPGANEYGPPPNSTSFETVLPIRVNASSQQNASSNLAKLDDEYFKNYAKKLETPISNVMSAAPKPSFGQARPTFGKR